jgi:hypothetical protein
MVSLDPARCHCKQKFNQKSIQIFLHILFISKILDTVDSSELGKMLEDKTTGEYNKNLLSLFGT